MTSTFPHARKPARGYDVDEVEAFLARARAAYMADTSAGSSADADAVLTAETIRRTAFTLRKDGYASEHVDAALERLEDAFAKRERDAVVSERGDQTWFSDARGAAQSILDRLVRPIGHRFSRTGILAVGYSVKEVDAFVDRITAFLRTGAPLAATDVRAVAFRSQRGGYDEAQVDLLLDATVSVIVAVK